MRTGILYLIDRLAVGGTERQLGLLLKGLDRELFQPHLGTIRPGGERIDLPDDVPLLPLDFKSFFSPSTVNCLWQLGIYIRNQRIRIVQTFFQDPTLLAAFSRVFHQARLVGSFRDLGFWRNWRESMKMRLAFPAFNGFIANSNAVKEYFVGTDGIPPQKIIVIANGIVMPATPPRTEFSKNPGTPLVGIVANLNRSVKRIEDFIKAAALVRQRFPEVSFVIVGDGHLRSEFEALSRNLGLGEVLKFAGEVLHPIEMIREFHVGVNTSETEGLSNAILEYMACGVPVVATATGGNSELVHDGENGFLVPVGDVNRMAERIVALLGEPDLRARMSAANLTRARCDFAPERMISAHEKYYEQLLVQ